MAVQRARAPVQKARERAARVVAGQVGAAAARRRFPGRGRPRPRAQLSGAVGEATGGAEAAAARGPTVAELGLAGA